MRIAFYAPFKPLDHKNPSGDLTIARGLVGFLKGRGHIIDVQKSTRTRWVYFKPWLWPLLGLDFLRCLKHLKTQPPDLWLTYHTYYKAPDLFGPWICRLLGIKYVIFQGIYSTKRKKKLKTSPGFYLNRAALTRADHVFTNKKNDYKNLTRLVLQERLTYIRPGIKKDAFKKDERAGIELKKKWGIENSCPIILTAGMFRDDVKTQGLIWLIKCLARHEKSSLRFHLVIAGSGKMENELKNIAHKYIPGQYTFAGKIHGKDMLKFYSSGDLFAFPGIREALGMVFLEAQSCSLPVVAFKNGGIPEVVEDKKTGFLVPMYDCKRFSDMVQYLLSNDKVCKQMGKNARTHVEMHHDIDENYSRLELVLQKVIA